MGGGPFTVRGPLSGRENVKASSKREARNEEEKPVKSFGREGFGQRNKRQENYGGTNWLGATKKKKKHQKLFAR